LWKIIKYEMRSKMNKRNKYYQFSILLTILLICSSCGRQLVIPYTSDSNVDTQIFLKPIKPTGRTLITINDSVIVNKKFIKSVTIDHLPSGVYTINYASDVNTMVAKIDTTMTIVVEDHKETSIIIDVPPYNSWYYISNALIGLLLIVPLTFIF
jgi:hypothetical protein